MVRKKTNDLMVGDKLKFLFDYRKIVKIDNTRYDPKRKEYFKTLIIESENDGCHTEKMIVYQNESFLVNPLND